MSQLVPLPPVQTPPLPAFSPTALLDGVTYTLHFQWNTTDEAWRLRILDEPGQVVLMGDTRVGVSWPEYSAQTWIRFPAGALVFVDTSGQSQDPGLADLGARVQCLYFTAAELGL